jgi:prepilin-type N-terminal cleavage/methylation domain-containing protein
MKQRSAAGYSLVEVLIALAITSVVLLTVVTLFYMGRRNVYSGKQMTYAVSVGTRMLEDMSSLQSTDVLTAFNINDATTPGTVKVQGLTAAGYGYTTYTNSAGGEPPSPGVNGTAIDTSTCTGSGSPVVYTCANDTNGYIAKWKALVTEANLTNGEAGLVLTPRNPANPPTCTNCPWTTARFLKIRAYVQWDEAKGRRRVAIFDATKINRD